MKKDRDDGGGVVLSRADSDIENLCGFSSGKFTGAGVVFTFILGVIFWVIFYLPLYFVHRDNPDNQVVAMFFHGGAENRSTIPYYTLFLTCWALAMLLVKYLKLRTQRKALALRIIPDEPDFVLTSATAAEVLNRINVLVENPQEFVLFDRISRALQNLKNLGDVNTVSECLNTSARNDDEFLGGSYTVLKGFIWAIPVLGFIGTVLGLAEAVGGFGRVVAAGAGIEELKSALGGVTNGLSVAFETTLIALIAALIVQLLMTFLISREELFLDECADYCHQSVISRIRSIETVAVPAAAGEREGI